MNENDLLTSFRENRSEEAFSELVRRHTNLVYSAARRRLSDDSLAQEATQLVFIRLATSAPKLRADTELVAWLHRTTLHVSVDLWRSESRRRAREEKAIAMQSDRTDPATWSDLTPVIDEALNELNDADRQSLLLRFFQQKTMRDVGTVFGVSEDAAKMRVSRALDRLRARLKRYGVTCTAIALGAFLAENSVQAAPAAVTAVLTTLKLPAASTGAVAATTKFSGISIPAIAAIVAVIAALIVVKPFHPSLTGNNSAALKTAAVNPASPTSTTQTAAFADDATTPDPRKLLQAVIRARQRIVSGSAEFQISSEFMNHGRPQTNSIRLNVTFDSGKLRSESFGREYAYVPSGEEEDALAEAKRTVEEGHLTNEEAERAGLLKGQDTHLVITCDGEAVFVYREGDDAVIHDPAKYSSANFAFDPRCLGLAEIPRVQNRLERYFDYSEVKSIKLVGKESLDGSLAWHIQVEPGTYEGTLDYWIDEAHPERLLKFVFESPYQRTVTTSKYDEASSSNPIPSETTMVLHQRNDRVHTSRVVRSAAQLNTPIDPAMFTLAGLEMKVGTPVVDVRIQRRIGYWTGTGLSEDLPKSKGPQVVPDMSELLSLLQSDPTCTDALEAAQWIVLNTPDGPEVETAAEVILKHHITNPGLMHLAQELERVRHRSSKPLLEAMVKQNSSADVRATACFNLAVIAKDKANHGEDKAATAEAGKLFERVINEFGPTGSVGNLLARRAYPLLEDLRSLNTGQAAPELEGEDLEGRKLKLSDYRGKVVVLLFWSEHSGYDLIEYRDWAAKLSGKPFALLGVYCDRDPEKAKAMVEKYKVNFPTLRDGNASPIVDAWPVKGWPTAILLDAKGVIRYRNSGLPYQPLRDAVDQLLGQ